MAKTSLTAVLLLLLVSAALVQGQDGSLTVKLAETDFSSHENDGFLNITAVVTIAGLDPGPNQLELSFEALTKPEFLERSGAAENALVCNGLTLQDIDLGRADELLVTKINCITDPPTRNNSAINVMCSFPIRQDDVFERDEYLVIVMTVTETGGNTIMNTERNCAIGRVLQNDDPANEVDFRLTTINGPLRVTEGDTLDLVLTRQFNTELPIQVSVQGNGADNTFPVAGEDYTDTSMEIVFPGNQTTLTIPIEFINNDEPENVEVVNFALTAIVMLGENTQLSVPIEPSSITVSIFDDEVLVSGFDTTENTITITEGEELVLSGELKTFDLNDPASPFLLRSIILDLDTVDNTATVGTDYNIIRPDERDILNTFDPIRFTIRARADDDLPQASRSFQAILVDEGLAALTDPDDIRRHREVNKINPGNITIIILDDDGTPNTPTVTFGAGPIFQWETDEEDQARPVECYYGNITVRKPDSEEEVVEFDFCNDANGLGSEFELPDFDDDNEYVVIVCSRNRLGDACTAPLTHTPPPFTTEVLLTTVTMATTVGVGMTGQQAGTIVGIVVGVLLGCCLLWLLLLLILLLCCCCGAREKRYFPQKREEMFAKQGHKHEAYYSAEEFDDVKIPLD